MQVRLQSTHKKTKKVSTLRPTLISQTMDAKPSGNLAGNKPGGTLYRTFWRPKVDLIQRTVLSRKDLVDAKRGGELEGLLDAKGEGASPKIHMAAVKQI